MAESPKIPADVCRADVSRVVERGKSDVLMNGTARAADSVPVAVGPFTALPTQFGRYRIEKLLGKGAMGAVYLAHDIQLDRPVALKVARVSGSGSAKLIQRMETEAKAAAKLDHPQICKVYDFGEIDGIRFIALQYIAGEDLKSYLKRVGAKRPPDEAVRWIVRLAAALEVAHEKGVIHRDLKPENIMLDRKHEPVIMDFGLARNMTGVANAGLTQGMILGTAAYMSPEQAIGKANGIDHRSDLYALGVMLFEMLTGQWPFTGSAIEVMGKKSVQEAPSPLSLNPNISPQLAAICQKLIARKREDRYTTCAEIIAALKAADLKSPAAFEMQVHAPDDPSHSEVQGVRQFDFFDSLPDARSASIDTPIGKRTQLIPTRISQSLAVFGNWWRHQPMPFRWTFLAASSGCLLLAMTLLFRSGDAFVMVNVHVDEVEVTFHNEMLTIADGAHQFKVKPGDQTLHIKLGNVEFDTDNFTLKRGDNPAVTVELVNSEIVAKFGKDQISRKQLSDGSAKRINDKRIRNTLEKSDSFNAMNQTLASNDQVAAPTRAPFNAPAAQTVQNARLEGTWSHIIPWNDGEDRVIILRGVRSKNGESHFEFLQQYWSYQPVFKEARTNGNELEIHFTMVSYQDEKNVSPYTLKYLLKYEGGKWHGHLYESWKPSPSTVALTLISQPAEK